MLRAPESFSVGQVASLDVFKRELGLLFWFRSLFPLPLSGGFLLVIWFFFFIPGTYLAMMHRWCFGRVNVVGRGDA